MLLGGLCKCSSIEVELVIRLYNVIIEQRLTKIGHCAVKRYKAARLHRVQRVGVGAPDDVDTDDGAGHGVAIDALDIAPSFHARK